MIDRVIDVQSAKQTLTPLESINRKVEDKEKQIWAFLVEQGHHKQKISQIRSQLGLSPNTLDSQDLVLKTIKDDPSCALTPIQSAEINEIDNRKSIPFNYTDPLSLTSLEQALYATRRDDIVFLAATTGIRPKQILHILAQKWQNEKIDSGNELPTQDPNELSFINRLIETQQNYVQPLESEFFFMQLDLKSPQQQLNILRSEQQIIQFEDKIQKQKEAELQKLQSEKDDSHLAHVNLLMENIPKDWDFDPGHFRNFTSSQFITALNMVMDGTLTKRALAQAIINTTNPSQDSGSTSSTQPVRVK